jgi:hypothetical protein
MDFEWIGCRARDEAQKWYATHGRSLLVAQGLLPPLLYFEKGKFVWCVGGVSWQQVKPLLV